MSRSARSEIQARNATTFGSCACARQQPRGGRRSARSARYDLAPKIQAWAGAQPSLPGDGRSLARLLAGHEERRAFAWSEWDLGAGRCGVPLRLRTVRTERYKLAVELDSGVGELDDLVDDRDGMEDRFSDDGYAGVARELGATIDSRALDNLAPRYEPSGMA